MYTKSNHLCNTAVLFFCLLTSANAVTYRLINGNYLDVGNRWQYQVHVTQDPEYGVVDWWGTQTEEVTGTESVSGYNTVIVESTESISGQASSWHKSNYYLSPDYLYQVRYEDSEWIRIVRNNKPFIDAPIWVSDSDNNRYLGHSEHYGIWKYPYFEWEGYGDTYVTFLRTETITVPAGTFDCIVVSMHVEDHEFEGLWMQADMTAWVEPYIGPIKNDDYYFWAWIPGEGASEGRQTDELLSVNMSPAKVTQPTPPDGATNKHINFDISWAESVLATSYNVYFGECGNLEFKGNQSETTYDPGTLSGCTTYCWRIDAVNTNGTTTGNVWSFTTKAVVPDVQNMIEEDAELLLSEAGLTTGTITYDYSPTVVAGGVIDQNPAAQTKVPCGSSVDLVISEGPYIMDPDIDGDYLVDLSDYCLLVDWWLVDDCNETNLWCQGADLYQTGTVDIFDLDILSNSWLADFSLMAHWPMDDSLPNTVVEDVTGNGNDGQAQINTELLTEAGKINSALSFNGIDDYIEIPNSDFIDIFGTGAELTVCGWFKFNALDRPQTLIWKSDGTHQYFLIFNQSAKLVFGVFEDDVKSSKAVYLSDQTFDDDWIFIAGVFNGFRAHLYLNGMPAGTIGDEIDVIRSTGANLYIGNRHASTYNFDGTVDHVMIYGRALSEQEILSLAQTPN